MGLVLEDIVMVQDLPERVSHFELKQLFSTKGRKVTELKIPLDKVLKSFLFPIRAQVILVMQHSYDFRMRRMPTTSLRMRGLCIRDSD